MNEIQWSLNITDIPVDAKSVRCIEWSGLLLFTEVRDLKNAPLFRRVCHQTVRFAISSGYCIAIQDSFSCFLGVTPLEGQIGCSFLKSLVASLVVMLLAPTGARFMVWIARSGQHGLSQCLAPLIRFWVPAWILFDTSNQRCQDWSTGICHCWPSSAYT